jgi:uncharacterized RDD family membrane protein YckC
MPKCPKCQYFSFDNGDRCRNCGYDFSLVIELPADDLKIQDGTEPVGPLDDFALNETPSSLPLFTPAGDPDAPLVAPNPTPRAPLAVRRTAPTTTRPARARRERPPDPEPRLALDTAEMAITPTAPSAGEAVEAPASVPGSADGAGVVARVAAAAIDGVLLAGIDVMVLYFTLKICDLTFGDVLLLPAGPLLSFLALLDGGYVTAFVAAGGQTIGKMATGIRVVPADPAAPVSERVTLGRAILRAAALFIALLPAGIGLLPALFGEHRGLHDRLADTRVIKA